MMSGALRDKVEAYVPPLMPADVRRAVAIGQILIVVVVACVVSFIIAVFRRN
jgi:hypothetical protein